MKIQEQRNELLYYYNQDKSFPGLTASSRLDEELGVGVFVGATAAGAIKTTIVNFASGKASDQPNVPARLVTTSGKAVKIKQLLAGSRKVMVPQQPTSTVYR
jgi:hypothetical protein